MKTKEELNTLKEKAEAMNMKLTELSDEELNLVSGGTTEEDYEALYQLWSAGYPKNEEGIPIMNGAICPRCYNQPSLFTSLSHGYFHFRCLKNPEHTWYS